jgi:hypothetical protein
MTVGGLSRRACSRRLGPEAEGTLVPIHDWTRVDVGSFHHLHQRWIITIADVLNQRLLPEEYYALAEQHGGGSDVRITAETDLEFYRRKQSVVAVRHASGDRLVAIVEVVSKGNKSGRKAFEDFVRKAAEFLSHRVHLLIVDLQPTTARDPQGVHGAIWDEVAGQEYARPAYKPLTLAAYESGAVVRAFVEPVGVGDALIDMPLFLDPGRYVAAPLEETYRAAFDSVPRRWRTVLEPG